MLHLKLGKHHKLVHHNALPKHVQESNSGALELCLSDDALAHTVHETDVSVDHVHAPVANRPPFLF